MPLSRLEKFYLKLGVLLCILSFLILLFFWKELPQEIKCAHVDGFATHLIKTCNKIAFAWNMISSIILNFLLAFVCLIFVSPKVLNWQFSFLVNNKNSTIQYRISRSLFCSYFLGNSIVCLIFEWQNIQFALGRIEKVYPFVLQSLFVWLFFIVFFSSLLTFLFPLIPANGKSSCQNKIY